jgi:hypothetical protein
MTPTVRVFFGILMDKYMIAGRMGVPPNEVTETDVARFTSHYQTSDMHIATTEEHLIVAVYIPGKMAVHQSSLFCLDKDLLAVSAESIRKFRAALENMKVHRSDPDWTVMVSDEEDDE